MTMAARQFPPVVLILDDNVDTAEMYSNALLDEGFTTVEAHSINGPLAWVFDEPPAAVVTDLLFAGSEDGLTLTRRLREDPRTSGIRIVVVSGLPTVVYREAALRAGCDLFLAKPCLPEALAARVLDLVTTAGEQSHTAGADIP